MAVHVIVNHKYARPPRRAARLRVSRSSPAAARRAAPDLLVYGSDPGWVYSDMNGFGPFVGRSSGSSCTGRRGRCCSRGRAAVLGARARERVRQRLDSRGCGSPAGRRARRPGGAADRGLGGFIFYNTNVLNEYRTPARRPRGGRSTSGATSATRTRRSRASRGASCASRSIPDGAAAELRGSYRLVNRPRADRLVHVLVRPGARDPRAELRSRCHRRAPRHGRSWLPDLRSRRAARARRLARLTSTRVPAARLPNSGIAHRRRA
jgi:ABC-2 type transport system permease protein